MEWEEARVRGPIRWTIPRPWRVGLVATGLLVATSLLAAYGIGAQDVTSSWTARLGELPSLCIVAWSAMQGPRRVVATLAGLALAAVMFLLFNSVLRSSHPELFGTWETVWTIDAPLVLLQGGLIWGVLRLGSSLSGISIIDPRADCDSRWSIRRWMLVMFALALVVQCLRVSIEWYANMLGDTTPFGAMGPHPIDPRTKTKIESLWMMVAIIAAIPVVPILLAAWMFAGKRWRWWLFPVLGVLSVGWRWGVVQGLMALRQQVSWIRSLGLLLVDDWLGIAIAEWFVYTALVGLIPWMGYRWSDASSSLFHRKTLGTESGHSAAPPPQP